MELFSSWEKEVTGGAPFGLLNSFLVQVLPDGGGPVGFGLVSTYQIVDTLIDCITIIDCINIVSS